MVDENKTSTPTPVEACDGGDDPALQNETQKTHDTVATDHNGKAIIPSTNIVSPPLGLETPTPLNILHRLIYSLVYPAILGTYLYSIMFPANKPPGLVPFWMLLVVFYLAAQYTLGTFRNRTYTVPAFIVDFLEIGLMAYVLSAMAKMDNSVAQMLNIKMGLVALLIIPVVYRFGRWIYGTLNSDNWAFHVSLTVLSLIAALAAGCGFPESIPFGIFAVCVTIYLIAFVIFNKVIFKGCQAWLRPTTDHSK